MKYLALLLGIAACQGDETLTGYGAADRTWLLATIDDEPIETEITLNFPEPGSLSGRAPCNAYTGQQTVPYPWFKAENVVATRATCPDQALETRYLDALQKMTLAEVFETDLILSNEDGASLVFKAASP